MRRAGQAFGGVPRCDLLSLIVSVI